MKRQYRTLVSLGLLAAASVLAAADLPAGTAAGQAVAVKEVVPFIYVCINHKGPYTDMQDVIGQLLQEMQTQNIAPTGPMVGVYYNSPETTKPEDLMWEIGFPVTEQVLAQPLLRMKKWGFTTVAYATHTGPFEKAAETLIKVFEWIQANGYVLAGPIMEQYLSDPETVASNQLQTEIWVPVIKK